MYTFAIMALLGLAVVVVAKIGNRYLRLVPGAWAFALVALGLADQPEPVQRVVEASAGKDPRAGHIGKPDRPGSPHALRPGHQHTTPGTPSPASAWIRSPAITPAGLAPSPDPPCPGAGIPLRDAPRQSLKDW